LPNSASPIVVAPTLRFIFDIPFNCIEFIDVQQPSLPNDLHTTSLKDSSSNNYNDNLHGDVFAVLDLTNSDGILFFFLKCSFCVF
jgi:hypothetical protein